MRGVGPGDRDPRPFLCVLRGGAPVVRRGDAGDTMQARNVARTGFALRAEALRRKDTHDRTP